MNSSEQIPFLFSCNVSPSVTPKLDIGVTKSEPLTIAVPMTIFYSIIFFFGVWVLIQKHTDGWKVKQHLSCNVSPQMFCRFYLTVWAFWPYSWILIWESAPSVYTCSAWLYQVGNSSLLPPTSLSSVFPQNSKPNLLHNYFSQYFSLNCRCSAVVDHPSNVIPVLLGELSMASWPSCVQSLLYGPPNVLRHHQLGHCDLHDWTLCSNLPHHVVCLQLKG